MADSFSYNLQMAGYPFEKFDEKGKIDYPKFVEEFHNFPWMQQIGKANGGSEPTISVKNLTNNTVFWVSIIGDQRRHAYLVGIVYSKEAKSFLGLGKAKTVRWVEIYVAEQATMVEKTFKTFFDGKHEELMNQLRQLEKFDEMEAKI
jgi:hypothetical protein